MPTTYTTFQQHDPLRVPKGWGQQERALVVQLDEILDDIYRRFGRLRFEDLGKGLRKRIADDEGNYSTLSLAVDNLTLEVGDKYDKVSGITITSAGVDISGSQYVKIGTGNSQWTFNERGVVSNAGLAFGVEAVTVAEKGVALRDDGGTDVIAIYSRNLISGPIHGGLGDVGVYLHGYVHSEQQGKDIVMVYESEFYPSVNNAMCLGTASRVWKEGHFTDLYYTTGHQSSSREIKHDIQPMQDVGAVLDGLSPVTFIYNKDPKNSTRYGLIYEDTVDVLPDICQDNGKSKTINYMDLIPMLLKEIQSLRKRVETLEGNHV